MELVVVRHFSQNRCPMYLSGGILLKLYLQVAYCQSIFRSPFQVNPRNHC